MGDKKKKQYRAHWRQISPVEQKTLQSGSSRIAEITFDDGQVTQLSEVFLRRIMRDTEKILHGMPYADSIQNVINRVEAGIRIPPYMLVADIDVEDAAFLLDGFYGHLDKHAIIYVGPHDDLEIK